MAWPSATPPIQHPTLSRIYRPPQNGLPDSSSPSDSSENAEKVVNPPAHTRFPEQKSGIGKPRAPERQTGHDTDKNRSRHIGQQCQNRKIQMDRDTPDQVAADGSHRSAQTDPKQFAHEFYTPSSGQDPAGWFLRESRYDCRMITAATVSTTPFLFFSPCVGLVKKTDSGQGGHPLIPENHLEPAFSQQRGELLRPAGALSPGAVHVARMAQHHPGGPLSGGNGKARSARRVRSRSVTVSMGEAKKPPGSDTAKPVLTVPRSMPNRRSSALSFMPCHPFRGDMTASRISGAGCAVIPSTRSVWQKWKAPRSNGCCRSPI